MQKIAICGAGIVGIATAYYILQQLPSAEIILIDKNQPLTFTSSKSGENFRDYWPHHSMEALCSHSIDLMSQLKSENPDDEFLMKFSGYHFVSQHAEKPIFTDDNDPEFQKRNEVILASSTIQEKHPYLSPTIQKSVFIKKAGNVDSITMANLMLRKAKDKGLKFVEGEILNIEKKSTGFEIEINNHSTLNADQIILATGPFLNDTAKMIGLAFPIWNTLQRKFIISDPKGIIPEDMPFTIFSDGQKLDWSSEELDFFNEDETLKWLINGFPGAIHIKPESGGRIKMGWAFSTDQATPQWEVPTSPYFPQVVLKGASRFIPALAEYAENIPTPLIEYGGYYTRTEENWPLIGPTSIEDVFVNGAMAGFGTMAACAAGELCATYLSGKDLPKYASYFHPNRNENPLIQKELATLDLDGQL